jgi:hypothetical protein
MFVSLCPVLQRRVQAAASDASGARGTTKTEKGRGKGGKNADGNNQARLEALAAVQVSRRCKQTVCASKFSAFQQSAPPLAVALCLLGSIHPLLRLTRESAWFHSLLLFSAGATAATNLQVPPCCCSLP